MNWLKKHLFLKLMSGLFILAFICIAGIYTVSFLLGPPSLTTEENTIYYSHDGQVIGEEHGLEQRQWVHLRAISPAFIKATLIAEDQHFYDHNGFDYQRIIGAVLRDLKTMSLKEGASTLTQQYARNLYLSSDKTWTRKIKEAFYTVRLEMYYTKDEILEGYLNTIYYGDGAYGAEMASRHYFQKSAGELTVAESAMLAAIPKGPTYYSPFHNMKKAVKRQKLILGLMRDNQMIDQNTYDAAVHEQLAFAKPKQDEKKQIAPYFQDTVLKEAAGLLDTTTENVRSGGFKIYTTLNWQQQKTLHAKMDAVFSNDSSMQIGAIAMNPKTGGIQALIGGRNYQTSVYNRAIQAKRMPGSSFKPFLYYAALEHGYTPATMLQSKPTNFQLANGSVYQPSNFDGYYADKPITLAQALALSDNIYAVKTGMSIGIDTVIDTARKFGIDSKLPKVPSLALGTASVSVEDMAAGYSMLANGGRQIKGHTIEKIVDKTGKTVFSRNNQPGTQVLDPKKTFILTQLMTGMFDPALNGYMSVTGSTIAGKLTRVYAGKSGTTDTDSWMIGYSPDLVTGIWTGYDDNRPLEKVKEITYAKNVWAGFMEAAHQHIPEDTFEVPPGIIKVNIDPISGERATPYCPVSRVMYFEKGKEPQSYCTTHLPEDADGDTLFHHKNNNGRQKEKGFFERLFDRLFH